MELTSRFPPPQLLKLLKEQTSGYRVITVGSSAGGYAACLYGNWLGAERVYAFNPQFEVNSLLQSSTANTNPLLFRHQNDTELRCLFDIAHLINKIPIFYFVSEQSEWDASQMKHIGRNENFTIIILKSNHHGVPFPRVALNAILTSNPSKLIEINGLKFTPWGLSIHFVGTRKTLIGIIKQCIKFLKKKLHHV